jgi:hypothetical protein
LGTFPFCAVFYITGSWYSVTEFRYVEREFLKNLYHTEKLFYILEIPLKYITNFLFVNFYFKKLYSNFLVKTKPREINSEYITAILKKMLELVGVGKNFLNEPPAAQQLRDSIEIWDLIKLKSFCSSKEMVSKLKRTPTEWEKNICQLHIRQRTDNQNIQGT